MGQEQPQKLGRVSKGEIDIACLKARIHLDLMRDRKNNEIFKSQKQLVAKMSNKSRNKVQQKLLAERVINGLKYAQACKQLASYATMLRGQALFISQNLGKSEKLQPYLKALYSLLYAADHMGLSSMSELKAVMRSLNDPNVMLNFVSEDIKILLSPAPSSEQFTIYMLQYSERNDIPIDQINKIGHNIDKKFQNMPKQEDKQLEKQLAHKLQHHFKNDDNYRFSSQGVLGTRNNQNKPHDSPFPPNNQGYTPPPNNQGYIPPPNNQGYIPPPNNQGYIPPPPNNQGYIPPPNNQGYIPPPNNQGNYFPPPVIYMPKQVPNKKQGKNPQVDNFENLMSDLQIKNKDQVQYPSVDIDKYEKDKSNQQNDIQSQKKFQGKTNNSSFDQMMKDLQKK